MMDTIKKNIFSAVFYIAAILSFFAGNLIILVVLLFSRSKRDVFINISRIWAKFILLCGAIEVNVNGLKNLKFEGPKIIMSNHQGNFDIPILIAYIPLPFNFIIKKELFRIPFFNWDMKGRGDISIDRESARGSHSTLSSVAEMIEEGKTVLIFPEGTRSQDGKLGAFKKGGIFLALKTGAYVVPIAINGSFDIQPRKTFFINPRRVSVNIGKAIKISKIEEIEKIRGAIISLMGNS